MPVKLKDSDNNIYYANTEQDADGKETQVISGVSDWLFRRLFRALGRLTYDTSNQLRVSGPVTVSSGTVTTVSTVTTLTTCATVTTGNVGFGDMGKAATAMLASRQVANLGSKRNLIRS